ncbi:hypothetical protein [Vibrio sp. 99-70-13A1]|nr:hypothetical protein [Vibrio sp. 99-70-13A1]
MYAGIYALNPETAHLNASFIPFAITDITIVTYTLRDWYENYKQRSVSEN